MSENCGSSNVHSDFAMSSLYPTSCPMPTMGTVSGNDFWVELTNNFYFDGWYLQHKFYQDFSNGYRCTQKNYYKNGVYNIDMPHYDPLHLYHERPSNGIFTLEITLQSPPDYCDCPESPNGQWSDQLWIEYTDVEVEDLYLYYSSIGQTGPGFNEDYAWFELAYGTCMPVIFTNETPH